MADEPDEPERPDDDGEHFDDAELEAMLENFEEEFHEGEGGAGEPADPTGDEPSFEDELEGLLGDKAKAAFICTRLNSAELLAAFCQISDISAECIGSEQGWKRRCITTDRPANNCRRPSCSRRSPRSSKT